MCAHAAAQDVPVIFVTARAQSKELEEFIKQESLIMQDIGAAVDKMKNIQQLGVKLSSDDFGTGYSSLAALKTFPVARLKIDKSFVKDLATNEGDQGVTTVVISLGKKLKLKVIAEGVESEAQLAFLRDNNCDEIPGYHLSRPIAAAEVEALLYYYSCVFIASMIQCLRGWRRCHGRGMVGIAAGMGS